MKTGVTEDVAFDNGPLSPGVLLGGGTIPYPGISNVPEPPKMAEIIMVTGLGKGRSRGEAEVTPIVGIPAMLEVGTGAGVVWVL